MVQAEPTKQPGHEITERCASPMDIVMLGLSITSSWGNGHATTYRALMRALDRRGHRVLFLERDVPWYAANRDLPQPPYGQTELYTDLTDLQRRFSQTIATADLVMVGSYVPDGVAVGEWVTGHAQGITAFYDIDTPVTWRKLANQEAEYLIPSLIPRYNLYLSFSGGPILEKLEQEYGAALARPLYCSVDPDLYYPEPTEQTWDLGYMGTYSADRQQRVEQFILASALGQPRSHFVVAGPLYPATIQWPPNVERIEHLSPHQHRAFYNAQRFTLNLTRTDMVHLGYSPSVRLFEAAACGTPIISDEWPGLDSYFAFGTEILVAHRTEDILRYLIDITETDRRVMGDRARTAVLAHHTAERRAQELEAYVQECAALDHTDNRQKVKSR